jgi:hypothetical protein
MTLEQQVVSLELSKRLRELGVKQESLFYWVKHRQTAWPDPQLWFTGQIHEWNNKQPEAFKIDILYSAFTVAELGDMLPDRFRTDKRNGQYWASCEELLKPVVADTEADARAKLLIYLIENNLYDVSKHS